MKMTNENLEDIFDEVKVEENREFIKCDKKDCPNYGKNPLCYFHIYYNCYLYDREHKSL